MGGNNFAQEIQLGLAILEAIQAQKGTVYVTVDRTKYQVDIKKV